MISIIIVGYNSIKDLPNCLGSIFKSSFKNFEVVFVDNASTDGSSEYVIKNYPKVKVIRNINSGYAGGNNVGIKEGLKNKSEYFFLLNPDTIIDKDCLKLLVSSASGNDILQPLILLNKNGKNTNKVNTSGNFLNFLGFCYCDDYKKDMSLIEDKDIPTVSGAASFIPSRIIKDIGILEEHFFMYHEDVDLSWRARLNGYGLKLVSKSLVWHKYSFSKNKNKFFYSERNRVEFILRNYSLKTLLLIFPSFIINDLLVTLFSIIDGWFFKKIKAVFSVILDLNQIIRYRRSAKRKLKDKDLVRFLSYEVSFSEITNPLFHIYNLFLKGYWFLIKNLI